MASFVDQLEDELRRKGVDIDGEQRQDVSNTRLQEDLERGQARGSQVFGSRRNLADLQGDILSRRRDLAEGLESVELGAAREQARDQINLATQQGLQELRAIQGAQGIRGGVAAGQQLQGIQQGQERLQDLERDLLVANIEARRRGLGDFESTVGRRLAGIEASRTGEAQLGLSQRALDQGLTLAAQPIPQPRETLFDKATGATVICTAMYHHGFIDGEVYWHDSAYGKQVRDKAPDVYIGYYVWAKPIANLMEKHRAFAWFVSLFAKAWAMEMAHKQVPAHYKSNIFGKVMHKVGMPLCGALGKVLMRFKEWQVKHLI